MVDVYERFEGRNMKFCLVLGSEVDTGSKCQLGNLSEMSSDIYFFIWLCFLLIIYKKKIRNKYFHFLLVTFFVIIHSPVGSHGRDCEGVPTYGVRHLVAVFAFNWNAKWNKHFASFHSCQFLILINKMKHILISVLLSL